MTFSLFRAITYSIMFKEVLYDKGKVTAEMKYRLSKYILQVLLDEKLITTEEAIQTKAILLDKYNPYTRCLEEVDTWQSEL